MVFKLSKKIAFPNPKYAEDDGLLAVGGDLSIDRLLLAYSNGIFPWYSFREGLIEWWCPQDRFVIFPHKIHISHSMHTLLRKDIYTPTFNMAFRDVIHNCGQLRIKEEGAWLGPDMEEAYIRLHDQEFARSIEVWETNGEKVDPKKHRLVGGLYGVCIGNCFFGESMFSLVPSASKIALIYLARLMERAGGVMIDCQFETAHLKSMGGEHITYEEYMKYVRME